MTAGDVLFRGTHLVYVSLAKYLQLVQWIMYKPIRCATKSCVRMSHVLLSLQVLK